MQNERSRYMSDFTNATFSDFTNDKYVRFHKCYIFFTITEIFENHYRDLQPVFELVRPNSTFHNTNSNLSVWTTFMLNSHQISSRLALGRYKFRVFGHLKFRVFYAKNSKWSSQIFRFKTLYWTILEDLLCILKRSCICFSM
jgi:hypothetical protein